MDAQEFLLGTSLSRQTVMQIIASSLGHPPAVCCLLYEFAVLHTLTGRDVGIERIVKRGLTVCMDIPEFRTARTIETAVTYLASSD